MAKQFETKLNTVCSICNVIYKSSNNNLQTSRIENNCKTQLIFHFDFKRATFYILNYYFVFKTTNICTSFYNRSYLNKMPYQVRVNN